MSRRRVYVAGSYSADNVIQVLENMRLGIKASTEVFMAGFSPFSPWLDYHFSLMKPDGAMLKVEDFYQYSLAWLEVSDALLVLLNSEHSKGTQAEIERAIELGIPVFHSLDEVRTHFQGQLTLKFDRKDYKSCLT